MGGTGTLLQSLQVVQIGTADPENSVAVFYKVKHKCTQCPWILDIYPKEMKIQTKKPVHECS